MPDPRVVVVFRAAGEPLDGLLPGVEQDDLAELGALVAGDVLESGDLVEPGEVLGHDDVAAAAQVGRGHRQREGPQDVVHPAPDVPPPAHQAVQGVDVEVQRAGMPVGVERREGGLADTRWPVHKDQTRHAASLVAGAESELAHRGVPEDAATGVGVRHLLGQQGEQRAVVDAFGHAQERPVRTPHARSGPNASTRART